MVPARQPRGRQRRDGDVGNSASAKTVIMPAPQRQQWQWRQGNICKDTSTATVTMPKQHWQRCQRNATMEGRPVGCT
jgi:hypothetical protein